MSGLEKLLKGKQVAAIVCNQWGDTGKGKFVDYFAEEWADVIARGTGGANAGHTVFVNGKELILHLIPCGILNQEAYNVIGNGIVFDPVIFLNEAAMLKEKNVSLDRLYVSGEAHVTTPLQIIEDGLENMDKEEKIGTTGRGIGPTYADKAARRGIRINDLLNKDILAERLTKLFNFYSDVFTLHFDKNSNELTKAFATEKSAVKEYFINGVLSLDYMIEKLYEHGQGIKPFIRDTREFMAQALKEGKNILGEGAQGNLLGINTGTYPYVTSSDANSNGTLEGVGLPASMGDRLMVLGVVKFPIMTRVGYGPFATEIDDENNDNRREVEERYNLDELRQRGLESDDNALRIYLRVVSGEYGATTGRPRRPGWMDYVALKHSFKANGNKVILTKLDCCRLPVINVCHSYTYDGPDMEANGRAYRSGDNITVFPTDSYILKHCKPNFEEREWSEECISQAGSFEELPEPIRKIIKEEFEGRAGADVKIISVGKEREQTIIR